MIIYRKILALLFSALLFMVSPSQGRAEKGETYLVSSSSAGVQANRGSGVPSLSSNGRFIVFHSVASNLVTGDTNNAADVFVHDLLTGKTSRVSVDSRGIQANGDSLFPTISADGRFVAFQSAASNLVADDTNDVIDVFIRDRLTETTVRASVSSDGLQSNNVSSVPSMAPSGLFVVFQSAASNLVPDDTNDSVDVFIHNIGASETAIVSIGADGLPGNGNSFAPSVSSDGRFVVFHSSASNLTADDTNGFPDVFLRDRVSGENVLVSIDPLGEQGNSMSSEPSLSPDGRFIVFQSLATNLSALDQNGSFDVFIYDRSTGEVSLISANSSGRSGSSNSYFPSVSADGRFVAFVSSANDLVAGIGGQDNIFVHDRDTGENTVVSVSSAGSPANGTSLNPAISQDGRYVAFHSSASNLAEGDLNSAADVFLHDFRGAVNPVPVIRANGLPEPLTITSSDTLTVSVEFNPGQMAGTDADWWVAALTPFDWFYLDGGTAAWQPGLSVTYQGPLGTVGEAEVLSISGLPEGLYVFAFGVDLTMNGVLDLDSLTYETVTVSVTAPASTERQ